MTNFQQGKIYKIKNDVDAELYVGSTCKQYVSQRMVQHKYALQAFITRNQPGCFKLYQHMSRIGFEHFSIVLIETYPCNSRDELHAREGHWTEQLHATLNMKISGGVKSDWDRRYRNNHEDYIKEFHKQRRERDWDYLNEKFNCPCGGKYVRKCKERHFRCEKHQLYINEQMGGLNLIAL